FIVAIHHVVPDVLFPILIDALPGRAHGGPRVVPVQFRFASVLLVVPSQVRFALVPVPPLAGVARISLVARAIRTLVVVPALARPVIRLTAITFLPMLAFPR